MSEQSLVAAHGLTIGYREDQPVVFDVDLTANAGDIIAVVGPNGCGKSTLLKALAGGLRPISGTISIAQFPTNVFRPDLFRRLGVSYAPQSRACFSTLTVEENLRAAAYQLTDRRDASTWDYNMFTGFPELGPLRTRGAATLSGGEKKVLAFAMTLVPHARVLILDEPAAGLSAEWQEHMRERIASAAERGLAVVLAEQNLAFASRVATRAFVMRNGRVADVLSRDDFSRFLRSAENIAQRAHPRAPEE
jgi:branched-chain amino acid transport system ATP-binding protein